MISKHSFFVIFCFAVNVRNTFVRGRLWSNQRSGWVLQNYIDDCSETKSTQKHGFLFSEKSMLKNYSGWQAQKLYFRTKINLDGHDFGYRTALTPVLAWHKVTTIVLVRKINNGFGWIWVCWKVSTSFISFLVYL